MNGRAICPLPAGAFSLFTFNGDGHLVLMFLEVPTITIFARTDYDGGPVEEISPLSCRQVNLVTILGFALERVFFFTPIYGTHCDVMIVGMARHGR